jgi:hypothetical protein
MDAINRKFGFWTTVRVLVLSEMLRRRHAWELSLLDSRTRQDIGLPEIEIEPQSSGFTDGMAGCDGAGGSGCHVRFHPSCQATSICVIMPVTMW